MLIAPPEPTPTCVADKPGTTWSRHKQLCGKQAKGEWGGEPYCGIHLNGLKKRAETRQKYREQDKAREANRSTGKFLADQLLLRGIEATYDSSDTAVRLVIQEEQVRKLLFELDKYL